MEVGRDFLDFLNNYGRRQKSVKPFLDLFQLVNARGLKIDDLAFGMDAGVRAAARGRDLHFAVKKSGEGFFKNFLDGGTMGLFLKAIKSGAVILKNKLDVSHISDFSQ